MSRGFIKAAWTDVTSTPHWFGTLALLSSFACIPLAGPIAVYGYLYGWACATPHADGRTPLPSKLLGKGSGKQFARGLFFLMACTTCLLPLGAVALGRHALAPFRSAAYVMGAIESPDASWLVLVALCLPAAALLFVCASVATLRLDLDGKISKRMLPAGVWRTVRHASGGLWGIFVTVLGMQILFVCGVALIASLFVMASFLLLAIPLNVLPIAVLILTAGLEQMDFYTFDRFAAVLAQNVPFLAVMIAPFAYTAVFGMVTCAALRIRALGHWMKQAGE